jgi:hypothetical protein
MSLQEYTQYGNYIEYVIMKTNNMNYDISDHMFFDLLHNIKRKHNNVFQRHYKEYVFRNFVYENNKENQLQVYKKTLHFHKMHDRKFKVMTYHKEKLPFHIFPSTQNLHSITYVSKATFKINSRVFLNFERKKYEYSEEYYNKIYINYNHDSNVDLTTIEQAINEAIRLIEIQ